MDNRTCRRDKLKVIELKGEHVKEDRLLTSGGSIPNLSRASKSICSIHRVLSLPLKARQGFGGRWALGEQER